MGDIQLNITLTKTESITVAPEHGPEIVLTLPPGQWSIAEMWNESVKGWVILAARVG